jgi:ATP-dependent DNA helicase
METVIRTKTPTARLMLQDGNLSPHNVPAEGESEEVSQVLKSSIIEEQEKLQKELELEAKEENIEKLGGQKGFSKKEGKTKERVLDNLLQKASAYSTLLLTVTGPPPAQIVSDDKANGKKKAKKEKKDAGAAVQDATMSMASSTAIEQPAAMKGGTMKSYQREGLGWMARLFENGLNGILADEMGLGKTIQTIGLVAHIRQMGANGPILIVGPLSTVPNWHKEFKKWLPDMKRLIYHGSQEERAELRRKTMRLKKEKNPSEFPIVITSYEIVMRDRCYLSRYDWQYIVIDEGHRLKNMNCKLVQELKSYKSANRLLLTGTPLQNDLQELWSLLNFLLPEIFDDVHLFLDWFRFDSANDDEIIRQQKEEKAVSKLHEILRPFLLRRKKAQVDWDLPPKKELVLYAPMTKEQLEYYHLIQMDQLYEHLKERNNGAGAQTSGSKSLMNKLMQLRKCCNHPYLFDEPQVDGQYVTTEALVQASGKLALLDKMMLQLHKEGHKVLIFSQMTTMLDILEDYLIMRAKTHGGKNRRYCRIDGNVAWQDRQKAMDDFNERPEYTTFLLSTRAGGLGINLIAADTVIIFDSDWNPHQDSQAMDRCHRIGQTKPVVVYRLITAHSIENIMLGKANSKRKLERLVITRGNFKQRKASDALQNAASKKLGSEELKELLKDDVELREGDEADMSGAINDTELEMIMDRERLFADTENMGCAAEGYATKGKSPKGKSPSKKRKKADPVPQRGAGYEVVEEVTSQGILG